MHFRAPPSPKSTQHKMKPKIGRVVRMRNTRKSVQFRQRLLKAMKSVETIDPFHLVIKTCPRLGDHSTIYVIDEKGNLFQSGGWLFGVSRFNLRPFQSTIVQNGSYMYGRNNQLGPRSYKVTWDLDTNDVKFEDNAHIFQVGDVTFTHVGTCVSYKTFKIYLEYGGEYIKKIEPLQENYFAIITTYNLYVVQEATIKRLHRCDHFHQFSDSTLICVAYNHVRQINLNGDEDDEPVKFHIDLCGIIYRMFEYKDKKYIISNRGIYTLNVVDICLLYPYPGVMCEVQLNVREVLFVAGSCQSAFYIWNMESNAIRQILRHSKYTGKLTVLSDNFVFCASYNKIHILDIQAKTLTDVCEGELAFVVRTKADRDECTKRVISLFEDHISKDVSSIVSQFIM